MKDRLREAVNKIVQKALENSVIALGVKCPYCKKESGLKALEIWQSEHFKKLPEAIVDRMLTEMEMGNIILEEYRQGTVIARIAYILHTAQEKKMGGEK